MAALRRHFKTTLFAWLSLITLLVTPGFSHVIDDVPDVALDVVAPHSPMFHDGLSRGIELIFNDRFEEGLAIFDRLQKMHPNHPAPYFFRAAAYQNWMSSHRNKRFEKELEENVRLAIQKGNALLESEDDPWLYFYIGAAYGYRVFNRFRKHDWIGAYTDATNGINKFQEALDKDPNLYDAYLGLGSYHYWRTAKSEFLRIIALKTTHFPLWDIPRGCEYWIAVALRAQNKVPEALYWTERALAQSENRNVDLELEGPFEDFGEIKRFLERFRGDLKKKQDHIFIANGIPTLSTTQ